MSGRSKEPLHRYRRTDIDTMINRLEGLGLDRTWAGEQSRYLLALVDDANQRLAQLEAAWQAVERHDAGDLTLEQTQEAIDRAEPSELRPPPV